MIKIKKYKYAHYFTEEENFVSLTSILSCRDLALKEHIIVFFLASVVKIEYCQMLF